MFRNKKKRVEWGVRLERYNLSKDNAYELHPRVVLRDTLSLHDLALRLQWQTNGRYRAEETELIGRLLIDTAIDALVEGYAVQTDLGRLTPVVTGMWSMQRLVPSERAKNQATLAYALSKELKKAFENPLFHEEEPLLQGPYVYDVFDLNSQTHNQRLTPGGHVYLRGRHLLMHGDSPLRCVELLDDSDGHVVHRFSGDEVYRYMNTRSQIVLILPTELADGVYRLAVTTQCTTGPRPLKQPKRYVGRTLLRVGEEPVAVEEPQIDTDGTD